MGRTAGLVPVLGWLLAACGGAAAGTATEASPPAACPVGSGFCGVFVSNDCTASPCRQAPLAGLDTVELVRTDGGVPTGDPIVVEPTADGVFATPLAPGSYHLRPNGDRFRGFQFHVDEAPVVVDCRARGGDARLVGHVNVSVGGGAESESGETSISSGGPARFSVASVLPLVGDAQVDRSAPIFVIADQDGRFEVALAPGRYWVSDLIDAEETGRPRTFASSLNPITGQAVELAAGETKTVELVAWEMAP